MLNSEQVYHALRGVIDPELKHNLVELNMIRDVVITDGQVSFTLALTTLACPLKEQITAEARQAVLALEGVQEVKVSLAEMSATEKKQLKQGEAEPASLEHLNRISHVIAIMSGKGGVGKSLVSGLLAVALGQSGHRVGVLDADITGPSIPRMFFARPVRPEGTPLGGVLPVESRLGVKVMSINLLLEREDEPVIWRGPLIGRAIQQFWGEVLWGELDYLVVDLPPGTSDASLTVMQSLPLSGVVLVTSPQDLAGMVVRKAAQMVQRLEAPILGLIENMSYFVCPETGKRYEIFGPSHSEEMAARLGVPFLGRLPIDPEVARLCDAGRIEEYPAEIFREMAGQIVALAPPARAPKLAQN